MITGYSYRAFRCNADTLVRFCLFASVLVEFYIGWRLIGIRARETVGIASQTRSYNVPKEIVRVRERLEGATLWHPCRERHSKTRTNARVRRRFSLTEGVSHLAR